MSAEQGIQPPFITMPVPRARPFDTEVLPEHAQEVWDAFVKPEQDAQMPPSIEMRMLMAILRAFAQGRVVSDDE